MTSFNPVETGIAKSGNLKFRVAIPTETEHHQKTVHGEITCFNNFSRCIIKDSIPIRIAAQLKVSKTGEKQLTFYIKPEILTFEFLDTKWGITIYDEEINEILHDKGEKKFLFKSSFPGHHFLDQIEGEVDIILNFEKFESIQARVQQTRHSKNLTLTQPLPNPNLT